MNNTEEFLKELSELSKKHGLWIQGCGCCDSPYLASYFEGIYSSGNLSISKEGKYEHRGYIYDEED